MSPISSREDYTEQHISRPALNLIYTSQEFCGPYPDFSNGYNQERISNEGSVPVVKVSPNLVVKYGPYVKVTEAESLLFIELKAPGIPVPRVCAYYTIGPFDRDPDDFGSAYDTYIIMTFIKGRCLDKVWDDLDESQKTSIAAQLRVHVQEMRLDRASQERLQRYINEAVLAYPNLPALVTDNIENAVLRKAFAGVEKSSWLHYEQILYGNEDNDIHAAQAILAGHVLGLCQPWETEKNCDCEMYLPREVYLLAAYSSYGVEFVLTEETTSVYDVRAYTYNNYSLGFRSKPTEEPAIRIYWDDLRDLLRTVLRDHTGLKPRTLILYGDQCTDTEFQAAVDEVLGEVLGSERPQRLRDGVDPTFAGALGAAELATRKQWRNELCMIKAEQSEQLVLKN